MVPPKSHGPVRYMFPLFLGLAALLSATVLNSVSYSYIKIVPSATSLTKDDTFSLNVYAFAHVPVNAVDIALTFTNDAIEISSVDTGESVITLWTEKPYVEKDKVIMRGGTYQRGFKGEHLIAVINAKAKKTGPVDFAVADVDLLAGDGKGTAVLTGSLAESKANLYIYDFGDVHDGKIKASASVMVISDINGDGKVSVSDISVFLAAWHSKDRVYDFNSDGKMTFKDFAIILADSFFGR